MRARPAMSRGDSMRQTASIARWVSDAVTASDQTIFAPMRASHRLASASAARSSPVLLLPDLRPQRLLCCSGLRRELGAEVIRLKDLPNFDFRLTGHRVR